jgi:trehalose 6-phosphate phosphatase
MNGQEIENLTRKALSKPSLWLFLDYDGTLAEFAPTPEDITPVPQVVDLLKRLASKPAVRLTVLSGRGLADVRSLLPVPGIYLGGVYGVELQLPTGELVQRSTYDTIHPFLESIKGDWIGLIDHRAGFFLEDKGWALALHARFSEENEAEQVLAEAREVVDRSLPEELFRILGGHKFLEVAPLVAHKGDTVLYLLDKYPLPAAQLLYVGDDDKDEEAFIAIHERGGITVKVTSGSQPDYHTEADYLLDSPSVVNSWLETLYARL